MAGAAASIRTWSMTFLANLADGTMLLLRGKNAIQFVVPHTSSFSLPRAAFLSPSKQSCLKRPLRQAQAQRGRGHVHFMEIEKHESLAVLSAEESRRPAGPTGRDLQLPDLPSSARGSLGSDTSSIETMPAGIRRSSDRYRLVASANSQVEKAASFRHLTKSPVGPQKCLLGQILRTAAIPAEAVRQIDQRALPAPHDIFERVDIAGQNLLDVGLVVAGAHACSSRRSDPSKPATVAFSLWDQDSLKKRNRGLILGCRTVRRPIMTEDLAVALGGASRLSPLFTFLSVAAWTSARRKEREAYYKSEAIKKIAEMQGATPEPVLQILRETMAAWKDHPSPANMGPIQAKAYYRAEAIKKIAEMQGAGADAVLTVLREDEKISARRVRGRPETRGVHYLRRGSGRCSSLFGRLCPTCRSIWSASFLWLGRRCFARYSRTLTHQGLTAIGPLAAGEPHEGVPTETTR